MITLNKDKSNIHRIFISKSRNAVGIVFKMRLTNTSDEEIYLDVINEQKNDTYYVFTIDIKDLHLGEYKVEVLDICKATDQFDRIVATTLLKVTSSDKLVEFDEATQNIYYEA